MTVSSGRKKFLFEQSQVAKKRLDDCLHKTFDGVSELTTEQLSQFKGRSFLHGWSLPILETEGASLLLFLDERFPFTSPRLALTPPPRLLEYPHIEEDGVFCIDEEGQTSRAIDQSEVDALRLISEGIDLMGRLSDPKFREDEFRKEFLSYWSRAYNLKRKPLIYSILSLDRPSGEIAIWKHREGKDETWLVAESKEQALFWLKGFYADRNFFSKDKRFVKGYYLRCKQPPVPERYPRTNKDVLDLDGLKSEAIIRDFCQRFSHLPERVDILLSFEVENGFAPVLASLQKGNVQEAIGYIGDSRLSHLVKEGKIDNQAIGERYFEHAGDMPVTGYNIVRADHAWVHGRDQNDKSADLKQMKVAFVGLGSVGSVVTKHLARAGLGNGLLIDSQKLDFENISRHQVGGFRAGLTKAAGIYDYMRKAFPHLEGYVAVEMKWEEAYQDNPAIFEDCDLIILTTGGHGSGGAQLSLNRLSRIKRLPPVLYGWTEAFACAGHAVLLTGKEGCLECGFTGDSFEHAATQWNADTLSRVPACGQTFQPYGAIELENINTMIAGLAVDYLTGAIIEDTHKIWLGDSRLLSANGGNWSEVIKAEVIKNNPNGSLSKQGKWAQSRTCPVCRKNPENEVSSAQQA